MNALVRAQLVAITEVLDAANELGIEVWLRGGWAMDFFLGQVTRAHEDVDWFVWHKDMTLISGLLISRGWVDLAVHPLDQQRDLLRDQVEIGFAPLARTDSGGLAVGGGPFEGEPYPKDMIGNAVVGELESICCPIISPTAQIEIKRMMPVWVPGFRRRDKDIGDIARLEAALRKP
ncbi:nucleotidyltransferase domain-containing protein [Arthrobacter sp. AQ5-05]|uniref:nucleotidyltransferase domain-containing protein n=1 Tax=Arthrobacter sp. AQ5-05 TaxID=2184581 RepID=UPI0012B66B45|nr:aminoglycoside adenylyltransferase [Arthrobacter sp. AQ5-05]